MSPAAKTAPVAPEETMVTRAIHQAKSLEFEKRALLAQIDANRKLLRLLDDNNELDENQGTWMEDFYPQKEKGTSRPKEDIQRTRQVKNEAAKEIAAERGEVAPEDTNGEDDS